MTIVRVPRPPQSAMNKDRPVSSLLKNQILHLQEAEFRLPARDQTNIYINRIRTEGEAAEYIRQVTAKLHPESVALKHGRGMAIAAMAEEKPIRRKAKIAKGKTHGKRTGNRAHAKDRTRRKT